MDVKRNPVLFILFLLVAFGHTRGQDLYNPDDSTLAKSYNAAVIDAMVAEQSEICSTLVAIKPDNNYLSWSNGYVLVVTWTKYCSGYSVGDTISLSWGETWVTAVPELKDWYKRNPVPKDKLTIRTEQLLGLPVNSHDSCFVELWTKPADLFRPAYDNEIDTKFSGINFPVNVSSGYVTWFNNNIISSYYPSNESQKYPWTRLGYTYDWGNPSNKIGLSEFILKKNSKVIIKSKQSTADYIR
jgi:hypothetical protein